MKKLIALDFDGTLLNEDGVLSFENKEALIKQQEAGNTIVLCSGRSYDGMTDIAEQLNIDQYGGYIVSYNGGYAVRASDKEILFEQNFKVDTVQEIYDIVAGYAESFVTYGHGLINTNNVTERIQKSANLMQAKITTEVICHTPKIILEDDPEHIASIYEEVKMKIAQYDKSINVFRSVPQLIEITPANSTKGHGLERLIKTEGLREHRVIAFGDGENDLSMIEFAHVGVAMENGMENVKAAADIITKSNNDHGVKYGLENLVGE